MNCKQIHKLLPNYIDKKTSNKESEKIHLHLEDCKECSTVYKKLNNTIELLKPTKEITEQPFYYTRLKQRMENRSETHKLAYNSILLKKILQPAIYLASLIIAVYIGILIGSNSSIPNQYSKLNQDKNYIEEFAEYNYLNDLEIESIENLFLADSNSVNK